MATEKMNRFFGSFSIFMASQVFLNYTFIAIGGVMVFWSAANPETVSDQGRLVTSWFILLICGLFPVIRTALCGVSGFKWWKIHGRGVNRDELIRGIIIALALLSPAGIIVPFFGIPIAFGADIMCLTFIVFLATTTLEGEAVLSILFPTFFVGIFVSPVFPFIVFYAGYLLAKHTSKEENLRSGKY
ncbi:MAG: hypothetical protein ACFFD4_13385 [Candidatus Odinarchaeota archaeon]